MIEVQAPDGRVIEIEGDKIPSSAELDNIFKATGTTGKPMSQSSYNKEFNSMDYTLIFIIGIISIYCFIYNAAKFLKKLAVRDKNISPMGNTLPFLTFILLILTFFHYQEDCSPWDTLCFEYPYGFYTILRFVVCAYFSYNAFLIGHTRQLSPSCIISCLFAVIYNPFVKVIFELETWLVINFIALIALIIYQICHFYKV